MIADVRHHLSVAALYGRLSAQRALEYPFSLLSICLGLGFNYVWIGVALKVLVDRFQPLSGWTFSQLAFLYGLSLMSRGVMSILSFQSRLIDRFVTRGEFDLMLLRPLEVTFHFSCHRINVVGLVHLGIGTGYFLYGARLSGFVWTPLHVAEVLLVIAGGTLIYWSYLTLISSIAFWTMRSQPLVDASMELMARGTFYPLTVYPWPLQALLTFVLPLGFIFLGQSANTSLPLDVALWTPVVGIAMLALALAVFAAGLRRYESAGS
ncbi:MAG: ABC-2 family transporter protein [Candidatus Latescibacteria bacterium]|nr:ABC-2 family transporter protein [Candidatus Latescibacterota bacterium]